MNLTIDIALQDDEFTVIEENGVDMNILLSRVAGKYYATSDTCSHAKIRLSTGFLSGHTIICPLHGARFNLHSGRCVLGPTNRSIRTYPVSVQGDRIVIAID
jgi:nitrite reductase/ring-hydroxylating ferredoxin subunit